MPLMEEYEEEDFRFVKRLFDEWVPDPLPSDNWRGIVANNGALVPPPVPTGKPEQPTVYAAWALDVDDTEGDYEGENAPVRYGRLTVACFTEPGCRSGPLLLLRKALRKLVDALPDDGSIYLDIQAARPIRVGEVGGWYVENFVIPFVGG